MTQPIDKPQSRIVTARIVTNEHGETEYEGHSEAIAEAKEAMARAERRRELWGEIGPGAMTRLARAFPRCKTRPASSRGTLWSCSAGRCRARATGKRWRQSSLAWVQLPFWP
jgi:hypothetical protein